MYRYLLKVQQVAFVRIQSVGVFVDRQISVIDDDKTGMIKLSLI